MQAEHVTPRAEVEDDGSSKGSRARARAPKKEKSSDIQKSERVYKVIGPKTERPVPRRGLPRVQYFVQQGVQVLPKIVNVDFHFSNPRLTKHDALEQEYEFLIRELIRLAKNRRRTITVMNSKGGAGKSPTIIYMGGIFQEITNNPGLLIDANQNVGDVHKWAGIGRDAIDEVTGLTPLKMREAVQLREQLSHFDLILRRVAVHDQTGLRVILSEDIDTHKDSALTEEVIGELFGYTAEAVHSLFIDSGNGMSHAANLATIKKADSVVFPGLWEKNSSLDGICDTIAGYIKRGFGAKVWRQGYIAIHATPRQLSHEQVYKAFSERLYKNLTPKVKQVTDTKQRKAAIDRTMANLGLTPQRFFIIPYSKYIKQDAIMDVRPEVMGLATKVGILRLLVAVFANTLPNDPQGTINSSEEMDRELLDALEGSLQHTTSWRGSAK